MKRSCEEVQWIPGWTDIEYPYRLSRASYNINIYMSSSSYNIVTISPSVPVGSEFTGWAIIELSRRRRLRTLHRCVSVNVKCENQMWRIFLYPMHVGLPELSQTTWLLTPQSWLRNHLPCQHTAAERWNIIDRMHTWQQCSVTISQDILTTKYGFNLR